MVSKLLSFVQAHGRIQSEPDFRKQIEMPGGVYALEDGSLLALPRMDGDARYPYGSDGFNFWTYANGIMHGNQGLMTTFLKPGLGGEPKIAFFAIYDDLEGKDVVPLLGVPTMAHRRDALRYTIFTKSATYYMTEVADTYFMVEVFVDASHQLYMKLTIEHQGQNPQKLQIGTYFNPLIKHAMVENSTDAWFRKAQVLKAHDCVVFETYEEKDRSSMHTNYGVLKQHCVPKGNSRCLSVATTTSRNEWVGGPYVNLSASKALYEGHLPKQQSVCTFNETAIAGQLYHLEIGSSAEIFLRFAHTESEETFKALVAMPLDEGVRASKYQSLVEVEGQDDKSLRFSFHEPIHSIEPKVINTFMMHLKKQVAFCALIKGYVQMSSFSLIGIRDVFQAIEALLYWQPKQARAKMLEALDFIQEDGRCPRQYTLPIRPGETPVMDLRPFIDQGVWVISTIVTYLKVTKDMGFLSEICGYHIFLDDHKHLAKKSEQTGTVLEHMMAIMAYLLKQRDHGHTECVYALYGDWNDALDGLGTSLNPEKPYGTGVSVMATLQVYQNLSEMITLLKRLDEKAYAHTITEYETEQAKIKRGLMTYALVEAHDQQRILHGWGDQRHYLVGSFLDPDQKERDGLTSNAFWVLSGMLQADPSLKKSILEAYERLDSRYGLKTFHPPFEKGTYGVGRIPNLPPGTAENGATYVHASLFGVMSLFQMGASKLAWQQLEKLLPITHEKISCSPFVMPNAYGENLAFHIDGESMQDWQTGSSNVLLKICIRYIFGFEADYDGVYIQPAKEQPFKSLEMSLIYCESQITIRYNNQGNSKRIFKLDGVTIKGTYCEAMQLERLYIEDQRFNQAHHVIEVLDV